jgi:spore maturation protein CgeB
VRILYAANRYDYGRPEQGYSFEHNNLFDALVNMGNDILYFDFGTLMQSLGRVGMNKRLREVVRSERPDLLFGVLFRDELDRNTMREISLSGETVTFNWFCDDHWRFENFSSLWAPCFNWVATTAQSAVAKYRAIGYEHAIKTQWACNPFSYRRLGLPLTYDATFVGLPHGDRRYVLERVRDAGVDLSVWGAGWPAGRLSQPGMIEVFNRSRVNLNLSNASRPRTLWDRAAGFATRYLVQIPRGRTSRRAMLRLLSWLEPRPVAGASGRYLDQIKGRNFEVPGCGGFLLTGEADNLADYYVPGVEVVTFSTTDEMLTRIRYYLTHEDDRQAVADAGYARTLRGHTYVHRFADIFGRMGLPRPPVDEILSGQMRGGRVQDIE